MDALFWEQHLEVDIQLRIAARGARAVDKGRRDSVWRRLVSPVFPIRSRDIAPSDAAILQYRTRMCLLQPFVLYLMLKDVTFILVILLYYLSVILPVYLPGTRGEIVLVPWYWFLYLAEQEQWHDCKRLIVWSRRYFLEGSCYGWVQIMWDASSVIYVIDIETFVSFKI